MADRTSADDRRKPPERRDERSDREPTRPDPGALDRLGDEAPSGTFRIPRI